VLWTFANALHGTVDRDSPPQLGHASLEQYSRSVHTVVGRASQEHGVAAPEVNVASPEGIANSTVEASSRTSTSGLPVAVADELRAAAPRDWLPAHGCEPLDPPYRRFCQGPRRAAAPFGPAHELAKQLELGTLPTVNRLLSSEPRKDWVVAAGGPTGTHEPLSWPVRSGSLWRRFGYVRRPPFEHLLHRGIDVGAPHGTPLLAANGGIVAYSDNRVRGYGNLLVIVHADASVSFSAHCRAIYVFPGQRVQRGQIVGEVGDTGLARGAHVHWEYHVRGRPVDPERSFIKSGSS
jgi:murein DD-endopeptidase MepM/ murein hydrolase activator NlpD